MLPDYYSYTATFTPEEDSWLVEFPDLERCATNADTLEEAILQANNVLEDYMAILERDNMPVPEPTPYESIEVPAGGSKQRIVVQMQKARLRWSNETVRRTVTLPAWIDKEAQEEGLNLSQLLQGVLVRLLRRDTIKAKYRQYS